MQGLPEPWLLFSKPCLFFVPPGTFSNFSFGVTPVFFFECFDPLPQLRIFFLKTFPNPPPTRHETFPADTAHEIVFEQAPPGPLVTLGTAKEFPFLN